MGVAHVRTIAVDGTRLRYLGKLGPVAALKYSFTVPGGCEALTCALGIPARRRTDALDPGRIVQAVLGASVVWEGTLDEPSQTDAGWNLSAHGSGTWGADFTADYTGSWSSAAPDTVISNAAGRGLGWLPTSIGHPSGMYLGQPPDAGSVMIDGMLNQLCNNGGLTWQVKRTPGGNLCQVYSLPTTPTRLLVSTVPAPRTLGGDLNAIEIRYNSAPDAGGSFPAVYSTTWVTDTSSIARHGRKEAFMDLSSNGVMTAGAAQAVGNSVLNRYQRASFAGPYTARYGQLLTLGGQPCDLASFWHGNEGPMVCKTLLLDQAYGGEVNPGPVVFLVGRYEYDQDAGTVDITPFQTMAEDFGTLLSLKASAARGRKVVIRHHGKKEVEWRFRHSKHWHIRRHA